MFGFLIPLSVNSNCQPQPCLVKSTCMCLRGRKKHYLHDPEAATQLWWGETELVDQSAFVLILTGMSRLWPTSFRKWTLKSFSSRENWSRIRNQRYFNSPFLSYWRVTNLEMSVGACKEPAWQITWQIPAKTHYQYSCHWPLLCISPPATQAPSVSSSLILQPLRQLEWGGLLALLVLWTGQPEELYPHQNAPHEAAQVGDKWGFPLPVRFQWFPQTWGQNLVIQYCPWFHSWQGGTSSSNPPPLNHLQRSPHLLLWIYFFFGFNYQNCAYWDEFSPSTHDTEVALDWLSQADPVYIKQNGKKQTEL